MELLDQMVVVRPLKDGGELVKLNTEAGWDDHTPILPTHVFDKAGEVVGYASVGALTAVNTWFHSEKMKARDSISAISALENMVRLAGATGAVVPLSDKSPFIPVMHRLGYNNVGRANLLVKIF